MASGSMDHHIDIEAQNLSSLPPEEVGTSKIHEIGIRQPQAQREQDAGQEPPLAAPANPSTSFDVQQMVSQHEELPLPTRSSESGIQEADAQHSENERGSTSVHATSSTRGEQGENQAEIRIPHQQFGKILMMRGSHS